MPKAELFESIATRICNKTDSITAAECFEQRKNIRSICRNKCRIDEKSISQLEYVKSSVDENIFLKACPGSGKTEVVALKTAYELNNWNQLGGIAVLSFTQNAASVINSRVIDFAGVSKIGYPHYIGTIDSWLHSYIAHPFSHNLTGYEGKNRDKSLRLVDTSSDAGFLNNFVTKYSYANAKILAHQFYWEQEEDCPAFSSFNRAVDQSRTNEFNTKIKWKHEDLYDLKLKFWKAGFATYQDIEYLSFLLISECKELCDAISKRFPFIIVDECQDLSWIQLELLRHLKDSGSKLHFVGDVNQAIYEFKAVDPTKVLKFVDDNNFITNKLEMNYRSNQEVVNLCQEIVSGTHVAGTEITLFDSPCICINYKKSDIHKLSSWFENELKTKAIPIEKSSVVARGWSTVRKLRPCGNNSSMKIQEKAASAFYLWGSENKDGRKDALSYMGAFVSNRFFSKCNVSRKNYYCPDVISSPLKWRLFLAKVLEECKKTDGDLFDLSNNWSIWAKNIRLNIHLVLEKYKVMLADFDKVFEQCQFRALSGKSNVKVIDTIKDNFVGENNNLRTTTIHQVKGETLDAIMVVSSPTRQGTQDGHWSFWLKDPTNEKARLAYVASSRPKHLLVWAVPEISKSDKQQLKKLGFTIINLPDEIKKGVESIL